MNKITYKNFSIIYRKGHAATHFAGQVWYFPSLAACKRWISIVVGEAA